LPFETTDIRTFCDKIDFPSHLGCVWRKGAGWRNRWCSIISYVPAGGDIPDTALNPKFEHKLQFLDEMKACEPLHPRGG